MHLTRRTGLKLVAALMGTAVLPALVLPRTARAQDAI